VKTTRRYQKRDYYAKPESLFDDHPISTQPVEFTRISVKDLLQHSEEVGERIIQALRTQRFFVISLPDEDMSTLEETFSHMEEFFSKPLKEKTPYFKYSDADHFSRVGYERIIFDNEENRRDPEERDVFILYGGSEKKELDSIWPSTEFKESSLKMYNLLFSLSVDVLKTIAEGLHCPSGEFLHLIASKKSETEMITEPSTNPQSNMSMFQYTDPNQTYKEVQKCMVHQDNGIVTLLPRSTYPGIQILEKTGKYWIPME